MDVSSVSRSIEAVSQLLEVSQQMAMQQAEKLMKLNVEMSLPSQPGLGEIIDTLA